MELEKIKNRIVTIQGQQVILDSDVAELYSVETKRINEAVKNNPDKFPTGYIISLQQEDWENLKSKISTSSFPILLYSMPAIISISTKAFFGSVLTATADLAG